MKAVEWMLAAGCVVAVASASGAAMIEKWIRFQNEHRETLLKGSFRPHFPHLNYPIIEAESDKERIVVVYDPAVKFDLGRVDKPTYVVNGQTGVIQEVMR